ncbi:MAG: hypothetical protein IPK25_16560 [Saprospiraceae bacterium]|nr:hypothetical protein [Saprospiraceae bacterium]
MPEVTMDGATSGIAELKTTLQSTTKTLDNLQGILQSVEKGNGTISKLIYDENFYNNLNKTSRELSLLLQDLRLNPKGMHIFLYLEKTKGLYTSSGRSGTIRKKIEDYSLCKMTESFPVF